VKVLEQTLWNALQPELGRRITAMSCTYSRPGPIILPYRCQTQEGARPVTSPRTARAADPVRIGNPTCTTSGDAQKPAPAIPSAQFEKVFIFSLLTCNFPLCSLSFREVRESSGCALAFSQSQFLSCTDLHQRTRRPKSWQSCCTFPIR